MSIIRRDDRLGLNPTKIYILGAGCSACAGYPLAYQVKDRLRELARDKLTDPKLGVVKEWVEETVALLEKHGVDTVDQLAQALGSNSRESRDKVKNAKRAMSALFLAFEDEAVSKAFSTYTRLFEVIFSEGKSPFIEERLKTTKARVLTFNYDRLFEGTFLKWVRGQPTKLAEYERVTFRDLQAVFDGNDPSPDAERFALLKLHGSVAQHHFDGSNHQSDFHYKPDLEEGFDLAESLFGEKEKWVPMMVFPHEKEPDDEELKSLKHPFFRYQQSIWEHAQALCHHACEIHVLGYSMQAIDLFHFKKLVESATVQNTFLKRVTIADSPSQRLRLVRLMETLRTEFKGSWEIEFRPEKFFAQEWES